MSTDEASNPIFNINDRSAWSGRTHERRRKFRRLISLSYHSSFALGRWFPNAIPLLYVVGYPKSGTSWVGQMVADYLRLPFPQHSIFPIGGPSVFQGHQSVDKKLPTGIYAMRDGRDVTISGFHHLKSQFLAGGGSRAHRKYFQSIDLDAPLKQHLPSFIEHSVKHPFACRQNWGMHVKSYFDSDNPRVQLVRYEDLLEDPASCLSGLMTSLAGESDSQKIEETVSRFSFARQTSGAKRGNSYLRKGEKGDWTNHFDAESAKLFVHHYGESLVLAGYEKDGTWVDKIDA